MDRAWFSLGVKITIVFTFWAYNLLIKSVTRSFYHFSGFTENYVNLKLIFWLYIVKVFMSKYLWKSIYALQ